MRLLVVTQTVDVHDPVLGFFHRWIEVWAEEFEQIEVICLKEGEHRLPHNVRVHTLGKEHGGSRLEYAVRFLKLAFSLRSRYDAVLVHMNQEYLLIAGWLWKLLGTPVYLWRNHYDGSGLTDIAASFTKKVFCTSRFSYTAKYPQTVFMPVGVDAERFYVDESVARISRSILFLARMAPSKNPGILLEALRELKDRNVAFSAQFVGSPLKEHQQYYDRLIARARGYGLEQEVTFSPAIPHSKATALYQSHEIFVNCSAPGMLDKTLFEAAMCGARVVAASEEAVSRIPGSRSFPLHDSARLADMLEQALTETTKSVVLSTESLTALATRLRKEIEEPAAGKRKVLMAINCFNIGGAPSVVLKHLEGIDHARFEPWLLTLYASKPSNFLAEARRAVGGDRVLEFSLRNRSPFDMSTLLAIYRFLKRERFDVVVTHLFLANLLMRPLALLAGVPKVLAFEHSRYDGKRLWQKVADRLLAYGTDRIVVANEEIAEFTASQEGISRARFAVLPNPISLPERNDVELERIKREWDIPAATTVFLSIGRFSEEKGHRYLIEATQLLTHANRDFVIYIVGHGSQEGSLRAQVTALGLEQHVRIIVDPEKAAYGYYLADCFVLPSLREGESIAAREAMSAGLPIIASDLPTLRPLLQEGALLVPAADPSALARALTTLLADTALREKMGTVNLRAAKEFSSDSVLRDFENLLT